MATRPAGDFVVYACEFCGKRIFTERSHTGLKGVCPMCQVEHTVGGAPTVYAEEGVERRDNRRVPAPHARVLLGGAAPVERASLHPVRDVSETGIAFQLAHDPGLQVGQTLQLTLHTRELLRPRTYQAQVRRVGGEGDTFTVGLQFSGLSPEQEAEVRALVRRISEDAP